MLLLPDGFRSVRLRITALASLVVGIVLVSAALGLLAVLDRELTQQSDAAMQARALELADVLAADPTAVEPGTVDEEGLVQVVDDRGRVLAASDNLGDSGPVAPPEGVAADLQVSTITAPDDDETERYRVWSIARDGPSGVVTVFVGTSLESVDEATRTLRGLLMSGIPLLLVLLAAGTWQVVGRALARVELVRREVDQIGEDDLTRRLDAGPPDEVGRLVTTLNAMLARLEDGQRRQRDFVADASHELQSPVTAFRTQLEVARAHPAGVNWEGLVNDLVDDTDRMQALLQDLLLLARSDDGSVARTPLDLRDVVHEAVSRAPRMEVTVEEEGPAPVVGDEAQLVRAIGNLVDNAVRHARRTVVVAVGGADGIGWIRVSDDGAGVAAEHRNRVFDRFYRAERARSRARNSDRGTGLGLAIARSVARAHGGDVVLLGDGEQGGAEFELRIPLDRLT